MSIGVDDVTPDRRDGGFTLVELLIVIVILGILATVTVFAVRGITDDGQSSACATEFQQLQKAQEIHRVTHGAYADEATLVADGSMTGPSSLFDVTTNGDGYDVTPVAATCTQSATGVGQTAGGGAPVIPTAPVPGVNGLSAPTNVTMGSGHNVPGRRYGGTGNEEVLVFGRAEAAADWAATTAAGVRMDVAWRVTFMDIDDVATVTRLDAVVATANNNPPTSYAIFVDDDDATFDGYPSFADALTDVLTDPGYDDGPVHLLDADAVENLPWLFLQYQ